MSLIIVYEPLCFLSNEAYNLNFDISLAGHGYDLFLANPLNPAGDPGLKFAGNIFNLSCTPTNDSLGYWNFVEVDSYLHCQEEMETKSFRSYSGYVSSRFSSMSSSTGASVDASMTELMGFSMEASAKYSTESDSREKATLDLFEQEQGEMLMASAHCFVKEVSLNTLFYRPLFTRGFINALYILDGVLDAPEDTQLYAYRKFVETYGTHFFSKTRFGASNTFQKTFHSRSSSKKQSEERATHFQSSVEGCLGGSGFDPEEGLMASAKVCASHGESDSSDDSDSSNSGSTVSTTDIKVISKGSRPRQNVDSWASSK